MAPFRFIRRRSVLAPCALLIACGGTEPPARTAGDAPVVESGEGDHLHGIRASSEIGGMNEDAVNEAFTSSMSGLERCLSKGAERVEFLSGSVSFFLKIDTSGKVNHAHLEHSTLGDRTTEKCMLNALRSKPWPKPVGGDVGLARKSFDFDPPNDVRPPTTWLEDDAGPGLSKIGGDVSKCKNGHTGTFEATLYVGTGGEVLSVGVTPPDEAGDEAVDCLVQTLEGAKFPSPGSWPAKVTVKL